MREDDQEKFIEFFAEDDLKRLMRAVFQSSLIDYIKLQHSKNRTKKFLEQSFENSVNMFFDPTYTFEHFQDLETQTKDLSFLELMESFLDTKDLNIKNIHNHISQESMAYWWDKNFHNLEVPRTITISGIVWSTVNSPNNIFIDYENKRIYCPTNQINSDKTFFKLCLKIMCESSNIILEDEIFENFYKIFYLFLKINAPFKQRKK